MSEKDWDARATQIEAVPGPIGRAREATIAIADLAEERTALRIQRQAAVTEMRETMSLAEIGGELGLHRNRVQQISEGRTGATRGSSPTAPCSQCVEGATDCHKHHRPETPCSYCDHIRRIVDEAPALTEDQRARIACLLGGDAYAPNVAPVAPGAHRPPRVERVALYRHYDADGILLYVGISSDPKLRRRSHQRRSAWTEFAVREQVEWLPDRSTAEDAERDAIKVEKPLFNGAHTTPEAQVACVEYLIRRGRTDLLRFGS
jgi:hypothetical protein